MLSIQQVELISGPLNGPDTKAENEWEIILAKCSEEKFPKKIFHIIATYYYENEDPNLKNYYNNPKVQLMVKSIYPYSFDSATLKRIEDNDPSLKVINFSFMGVDDADLKLLLDKLQYNTNVTQLNIRNNALTDESLVHLEKFLRGKKHNALIVNMQENHLQSSLSFLSELLIQYTATAEYLFNRTRQVYFVENPLIYESGQLAKLLLETPNDLLTSNPDSTSMTMIAEQYDLMSECHCGSPMSRLNNPSVIDYRKMIENYFIKIYDTYDKNLPIKLASIGSGSLFQEGILTALLLKMGFTSILLDLVDKDYADHELMIDENRGNMILMFQFLTFLQNLGFRPLNGLINQPYTYLLMQKYGFKLFEERQSNKVQCNKPATVTISSFDSIDSYAQALQKGCPLPDAIVSIDLDISPEEQSYILNPLMTLAKEDTTFFTTYLRWIEKKRDYFQIEGKQKKQGSWLPLFDEQAFRTKVAPNDPFEVLHNMDGKLQK